MGFSFLNNSILLTGILNFYLACIKYSDSRHMNVQVRYKFLYLCVYANFQVSMSDCPSLLHSAEVWIIRFYTLKYFRRKYQS